MLYFGSRNFGEGNWGKGLITTAVDETLTTSTMQCAGYNFFNTSTFLNKSVTNVDTAGSLLKTGNLEVEGSATVKVRPFAIFFSRQSNPATGTMQVFGKIAWDSQFVDDATWTDQEVD
tara:strand:+ start:998 stop:1351 length:354 start_codon:yes stop_codon:yes gene_type:complete